MPKSVPDVVVINANIRSMDPHFPQVEAVAITAGRVSALGTSGDIAALAGSGTRVVDGHGRLILPGFHDTHLHVIEGGQHYDQAVDLSRAMSPHDVQVLLRNFAKTHARLWVEGGFYYSGVLADHNLNRKVLDAAVPDRPCIIVASDGHSACVNSKACELAGLVMGTADPVNGHFVIDGDGEPTGMLHERAVNWLRERMPPTGDDDFAQGVLYALALANRHGITGVLDASIKERYARVYSGLAQRNALTARVLATARVDPSETAADAVARVSLMRAEAVMPMFRIHSAKFFLDGVLENRTAAMIADYSDSLGGNASLRFTPARINEMFTAFDAARFQIHVHAIGDLATRAALDGFQAARQANGHWPCWHQIAHIQCIDPEDVPRFAELGVVANIQPLWARLEPSVTDVALPMVGEDRGRWMYAFRSLRDSGAMLALSSDWTVSTLNPFQIMETAVTRQPPARQGNHPVFLPEQRLTLSECVEGYTMNAATAGWRQHETGSLSPGKWADLIMLDRDIYECSPHDIGDTNVTMTLLAGNTVWEG